MNNLEFSYDNRFSQNNKEKFYFNLFRVQVIFNTLIIFIYSATTKNLFLFGPIILNICALYLKPDHDRILDRMNFIIQLFFQAFIIAESYFYLITLTTRLYGWTLPSSMALFLISVIVMYVPYVIVFFGSFHNKAMQLLIAFMLLEGLAMGTISIVTYGTVLYFNPLMIALNNSNFLGALVFLVLMLTLMRRWGYAFPHMRLSKNINKPVAIILLILCIWFVIWNAFGGGNSLLSSFVHFNFHGISLRAESIFSGLEVGIAEELLFRYVFLTILLEAFRYSRYKIFTAPLLSSLFFGLMHLTNLSAGQSLANTINQVIFAFGMGLFMCSIYLYTNAFYLPVIFHTTLDMLVFSVSGEMMTGKVTLADSLLSVLEMLVFAVIALALLYSVYNRRNTSF